MSGPGFRFLHASDLHVDQPLEGVSDVPEHLVTLFLHARRQAAEAVFEAAIQEAVSVLILSGHVAHIPTADATTLDFLYRQLCRVDAAGIDVYWLDTPQDEVAHWPTAIPLPASTRIVEAKDFNTQPLRRGGQVLANILMLPTSDQGIITAPTLAADPHRITIAVAHGELPAGRSWSTGVDYWALGGLHACNSKGAAPHGGTYCGSPQGASPSEPGPHGCLIVEVDSHGEFHRRFVETDVARWVTVPVEFTGGMDLTGLLRVLRARAAQLASGSRPLLVSWQLSDGGPQREVRGDGLAAQIRQGGGDAEILAALRSEFGSGNPPVWSSSLDVELPAVLPLNCLEEDTVLSDLLRCVQQYEADPERPLELVLPWTSSLAGEWPELARMAEVRDRGKLLRSVATVASDILRCDPVLAHRDSIGDLDRKRPL